MLASLKNHPFAVEAFFESSIVLTYAFPKDQLAPLLPPCLELDTFKDTYAFVAVAMVQTKALRPKGFPRFLGNDFFLIGYRIFVRYTSNSGKRLRGLYILKSETDKKKMELLGNIFTHYRYSTTDITKTQSANITSYLSKASNFQVSLDLSAEEAPLPANSPFTDWKEARRFAGPLPFTFRFDATTNEVLIIEGIRENWTPHPVSVLSHQFSFFDAMQLSHPVLANAFIIRNIPYYWKKGKTELWQ
ncbi:DUF2071 domain-containing protein [Chitinophaga rhizophila]|uniref:DUF2071 domain-containing protein n=1 Tax=Chitinophaga rhizophila TaxID=2866212 RepID=A0ABS7GL48_9BACT|nr:DUF2071 domain-containing protein [Chitinophaga rhizophila]MBW8687930.1 DUF2071 domain-containing protein [Chitinophaga rhizophila]